MRPSFPSLPSGRAWIPSTPTAGSTTSGTCSQARPVPATSQVPVAMERARLQTGSLLKLRTGSGVWHAEGTGEDELREGKSGTEMRGVLFWVNLARKYKGVEPSAQLLNPHDVPVRQVGEAIVRVL